MAIKTQLTNTMNVQHEENILINAVIDNQNKASLLVGLIGLGFDARPSRSNSKLVAFLNNLTDASRDHESTS